MNVSATSSCKPRIMTTEQRPVVDPRTIAPDQGFASRRAGRNASYGWLIATQLSQHGKVMQDRNFATIHTKRHRYLIFWQMCYSQSHYLFELASRVFSRNALATS